MDSPSILPFPHASRDPLDQDLAEIDAAIDLVAGRVATRIRLVGLTRPEAVAPIGIAHAQLRAVSFSLDRRGEGPFAVTVGPRI